VDERSEQTQTVVRGNRVAITAVVAAYNEEEYIERCIRTLLAQQAVDADVEILVIDGCSSDATAAIVRSLPGYGRNIRLITNPRRLQVHAWNIGLREMRGEYFAMILAHAEYDSNYFATCLETMKRFGADAVGGVQRPVGSGTLGRAIAWCMSTPLGMGNARYRYTNQEQLSDSVFSIFTRAQTLRDAGGFDESLPFDEDSDLCYRLRAAGARLVVSPRIGVRYHVRHTLKGLWKQMFRYGFWRRYTQLKHPGTVPWRVFVPSLFVAAIGVSVLAGFTPVPQLGLIVPVLYLAFVLAAAGFAASRAGPSALLVPATLATMHTAYGIGYLKAFVSVRKRPRGTRGRIAAR
jgi:glycosyltransferase involved in cell wall biosynthesis